MQGGLEVAEEAAQVLRLDHQMAREGVAVDCSLQDLAVVAAGDPVGLADACGRGAAFQGLQSQQELASGATQTVDACRKGAALQPLVAGACSALAKCGRCRRCLQ